MEHGAELEVAPDGLLRHRLQESFLCPYFRGAIVGDLQVGVKVGQVLELGR
jgi:hypothetical protein